jgi:hypothetical protein
LDRAILPALRLSFSERVDEFRFANPLPGETSRL